MYPNHTLKLSIFAPCPAFWVDVGKYTHVVAVSFLKTEEVNHMVHCLACFCWGCLHITLFFTVLLFLEKSFQTDVSLAIWRLQTCSNYSTKTSFVSANTLQISFQFTVIFCLLLSKISSVSFCRIRRTVLFSCNSCTKMLQIKVIPGTSNGSYFCRSQHWFKKQPETEPHQLYIPKLEPFYLNY